MKGQICPDISIPYYSIRGPHDLQWDAQKKTNFFGPGGRLNISFVCFSRRNRSCNCKCWMKTLKTKIQFEIPHLAFLCQNKKKKRNTHLSAGNVTLPWELYLLCLQKKWEINLQKAKFALLPGCLFLVLNWT